VSPLEQRAEAWIEPYWNAHHLVRARDYAVELDPEASEPVRLAALTHDIERHFPGGPHFDPRTMPPDDPAYNREHSERSARFVSEWLRAEGADDALEAAVDELVRMHEWGGTDEADVVQAADSLSFFEVNWEIVTLRWIREGRASPAQARAKLDWMLERIRLAGARDLALPLHARAVERLEAAA
jgi:HD domain-containing protein